jgi:hypothetical protein
MVDSPPENQLGDLGPGALPLMRRRWMEYNLDVPGPGRRYLSYLADELKPAVDRAFRTRPGPESTHALGSSMGGLCAFQSVWRRPDAFGNAACFSPVFNAPLAAEVALRGGEGLGGAGRRRPRIYIDNGGDAGDTRVSWLDGLNEGGWWWLDSSLQPGVDAMVAALRLHGAAVALEYRRAPGGRHSEREWGARAAPALRHLLAPEGASDGGGSREARAAAGMATGEDRSTRER